MTKEDKILDYLERIYRICKYRLLHELREEEFDVYTSLLFNEGVRKCLNNPDKSVKRREEKMDRLSNCIPWIGDITHEDEECANCGYSLEGVLFEKTKKFVTGGNLNAGEWVCSFDCHDKLLKKRCPSKRGK